MTDLASALLENIIDRPPVFAPYTKAVYSNNAYALLGMAYENITGHSLRDGFTKLFQEKA